MKHPSRYLMEGIQQLQERGRRRDLRWWHHVLDGVGAVLILASTWGCAIYLLYLWLNA